jgi:hypothetical protein
VIKLKNKSTIIFAVIALLVGAVAGFFGGKAYQASQTASLRSRYTGSFQGTGTANTNLTSVRGQILSNDDNSMVVKLSDGSTKIVIFGASIPISKMTAGSSTDLTAGTSVTVMGITNSDGSVSAQSVQIGTGAGARGVNASPSAKPSAKPTP